MRALSRLDTQRCFFKTSKIKSCTHSKPGQTCNICIFITQTTFTCYPNWIYSIFLHCYSKIHTNVKWIPFIQSTTWLVDHLLTGSMTRAIVEVFADAAKQRCERSSSAHSRSTQADFCPFFTRCMFILQILLWFLQTKRWWSFKFKALLCIPSQWSLWESCQNNVRFLLLSREVLSSFLSFSLTLRCL